MTIYEQIITAYPELTITESFDPFFNGTIELFDDGDGIVYLSKWNYSKPIPDGLKLGK